MAPLGASACIVQRLHDVPRAAPPATLYSFTIWLLLLNWFCRTRAESLSPSLSLSLLLSLLARERDKWKSQITCALRRENSICSLIDLSSGYILLSLCVCVCGTWHTLSSLVYVCLFGKVSIELFMLTVQSEVNILCAFMFLFQWIRKKIQEKHLW